MTADQFIWWLRGYLDSIGDETTDLPRADARVIRSGLDRVGPYVAPPVAASANTPSPFKQALDKAQAQAQNKCWRCGQVAPGVGAHFCNGTYVNG